MSDSQSVASGEQEDEAAQVERKSWPDTLKVVTNYLEQFSAASVVDAVLAMLRSAPTEPHKALGEFPWLLMLIAKWALQSPNATLSVGRKATIEDLKNMRGMLWNGGGSAHLERKDRAGGEINVFLMMRGLLYSQREFQREQIWGLFRSSGLIARLPTGHICRTLYQEAIGMEPVVFIDLGIALLYSTKEGAPGTVDPSLLAMLAPAYQKEIAVFLNLLSRSLPDLRLALRELPPAKGSRSRELYEFPYFKRYPLIQTRRGGYTLWHRSVLDRCLDEIVHLRLAQFGERYTNSFSRVFESYVVELAVATGLPAMNEQEFWDRCGGRQKVNAVEVILSSGSSKVLIEAKMGLFHEDVLLQETEKGVRDKAPAVLKAVRQGRSVSHRLVTEAASGSDEDGQHFLIVVTSRDLLIGTGLMLEAICGAASVEPDPEFANHRLPLSNVFVLPIIEYEQLMECVATGRIDLFEVMREAAAKCVSLSDSRYEFSDFYRFRVGEIPMPRLIDGVRAAALERMGAILGDVGEEPT